MMNLKHIADCILNKNVPGVNLLLQDGVLDWLFGNVVGITHQYEKEWGQKLINSTTNQWTTRLGEDILNEILLIRGENPTRIRNPLKNSNGKRMIPDFQTDLYLYENKARTFTTSGSCGEKILGTPMKYCECPRLYNKPLRIVCMGYQEVEADLNFNLFNPKSIELSKIIQYYKTEYNIEYIKATELLIDGLGM